MLLAGPSSESLPETELSASSVVLGRSGSGLPAAGWNRVGVRSGESRVVQAPGNAACSGAECRGACGITHLARRAWRRAVLRSTHAAVLLKGQPAGGRAPPGASSGRRREAPEERPSHEGPASRLERWAAAAWRMPPPGGCVVWMAGSAACAGLLWGEKWREPGTVTW